MLWLLIGFATLTETARRGPTTTPVSCASAGNCRFCRDRICRTDGEELCVAVDLTVYLSDQPGELARLGNALGAANVNIAGMCAVTSAGGEAEVEILVADDLATAIAALA
jgi:hypothetical protein